ncbi:MAG: PKD domain-containing protein, partial [Chitinophagaceae bacterium]|nr:PKD domain-containing protein [Chitinophagaceae bacterium]
MKARLLFLLLSPLALAAQVNLSAGLIAYYPFNGTTNDESGNQNTPFASNISFTQGRTGKNATAGYFNGKNSFLRIKHNQQLTPQEMTLVAIIKPMGFYMGKCYNNSIIDKGTSDYLSGVYSLRFTAGEYTGGDCDDPSLDHQNFVGAISTNAGSTSKNLWVKLNSWYCIVYTIGKYETKLYVNGKLMSTTAKRVPIGRNTDDLFIGKKNNSQFPYWYHGAIDEVRIYDRPLNAEEVAALCNTPTTNTPCTGDNKVAATFDHTISDCQTVEFTLAAAKQKNFSRIQWSFGDGSTSNKKNPVHTYQNYGTYKVRAIVTSRSGCRDTVIKTIQLQPLNTDFTFTEQGQPGQLTFRVKNNKASYAWNFGDDESSQGESAITHRYTTSGQYTVQLFARNSVGCTDTVQKKIDVLLPEPQAIANTPKDTVVITPPAIPNQTVQLEKRDRDVIRNIMVEHDSITLLLYDNGMIDGDTITLVYNNDILLTHQLLKSKPLT